MNWISVKERVPDTDRYVLIKTTQQWYSIASCISFIKDGKLNNSWHFMGCCEDYYVKDMHSTSNEKEIGHITSWMEIPE